MAKDRVPELLARATEALEAEFKALPPVSVRARSAGWTWWLRFSRQWHTACATTIPISILYMQGRC